MPVSALWRPAAKTAPRKTGEGGAGTHLLELTSENGKDFRATWQNLPLAKLGYFQDQGSILVPASRDMIRDVRKRAVEIPLTLPSPRWGEG